MNCFSIRTKALFFVIYFSKSIFPALLASTIGLVSVGSTVFAGQLFWTDTLSDRVNRMNDDGSSLAAIVSTDLASTVDVAADPLGQKIYWVENQHDRIERSNFDGSDREIIVSTNLFTPVALDIDTQSGKIYWVDNSTDSILRSNLDGSMIEDVSIDAEDTLAIDPVEHRIYWSDRGIYSAPLNNLADITFIVGTGSGRVRGIDIDSAAGKIYWGNFDQGEIRAANLDGTDVETLFTGLVGFTDLELDIATDQLYWSEQSGGMIHRASVDGSGLETIFTGSPGPAGLAFVPTIPEPTTLTLATLSLLAIAYRPRSRRRQTH